MRPGKISTPRRVCKPLMSTCIWFAPLFYFWVAMAPVASAQDYTHPRQMNLPPSEFEPPDPTALQLVLPNGLVAYIAEDHTVPLVSMTAFVRAGTADDRNQGAAEVLRRMLQLEGPSTMTRDGFAAALKNMAADYRVTMTAELTEIRLEVPAEDTWGALLLLAETLKLPNISAPALAQLQSQAGRRESASARASGESGPVLYEGSLDAAVRHFKEKLLAGHPYGEKPDAADYAALTVDQVRGFYRRLFVPGNTVLAIAGDFAAEEIRAACAQHFETWQRAPRPPAPAPVRLNLPTARRMFTYNTQTLQGWLVLGHELPPVPLEDEAALQVMNYILGGGHFDTRLFRETRDKRGLTNDDSGFLEPYWFGPGTYTFRTYGRPEVLHLLAELTLREIDRIRSEPVSEEELFVAKNALAEGEFEMWFENGEATARTYALEWLRYRNHQATAGYRSRVRAVTAEDVQAAAQKYLHPNRMQFVLIGPLEKIRQASYPEGTLRLQSIAEWQE